MDTEVSHMFPFIAIVFFFPLFTVFEFTMNFTVPKQTRFYAEWYNALTCDSVWPGLKAPH